MDTGNRPHVESVASHFEHGQATKTVADRREATVHLHLRAKPVNSRTCPSAQDAGIATQLSDQSHNPLAITGDAVPVHVDGECDIALFGNSPCPVPGVVIQPRAAVHDDHARAWIVSRGVVNEVSSQRCSAVDVWNGTRDQAHGGSFGEEFLDAGMNRRY